MSECLVIDARSGREISRQEIAVAAAWFRSLLSQSEAIQKGRRPRVVLIIADRLLAAVWTLTALLNECVVNPINPESPREQIDIQLRRTEPDFVVTDTPHNYEIGSARQLRADAQMYAEQSATPAGQLLAVRGDLLLYTSGTTGNPKGVLLRAEELAANVTTAVGAFAYERGWRTGSVLPLFHSFTIISDLLVMLEIGGTCVLCGTCTLTNLPAIYEAMRKYEVKSYSAVPLMFQLLARFWPTEGVPSLRFGVSGAAPLTPEVRRRSERAMGHAIVPCYGMTEACCFITITPLGQTRDGSSVGVPSGLDLRILDEDGRTLPADATGEIAIRGPSVIKDGYFTGGPDLRDLYRDGYLLTGDIGRKDASGWVYITGRKKNMMIKAGEKVYLEDVDILVGENEEVVDCATIVLSEPGRDDEAACFAVARESDSVRLELKLRESIRERMGSRAVPKVIHWVAEIPRTPTGKAKVAALRQLHLQLTARHTAS